MDSLSIKNQLYNNVTYNIYCLYTCTHNKVTTTRCRHNNLHTMICLCYMFQRHVVAHDYTILLSLSLSERAFPNKKRGHVVFLTMRHPCYLRQHLRNYDVCSYTLTKWNISYTETHLLPKLMCMYCKNLQINKLQKTRKDTQSYCLLGCV